MIQAINFSDFQNSEKWGVVKAQSCRYHLHDYLGVLWGNHSNWFPGFLILLERQFLGVGRVVAKESHSLFGGLQLSTQAK